MTAVLTFLVDHVEVVALEVAMILLWVASRVSKRLGTLVDRSIKTCRTLFRDPRIPKVAKAFIALAFIPIPGPFDEIMASVAILILWHGGHGHIVKAAWKES